MALRECSEHLYAGFSPKEDGVGAKHGLYQWSLPEGSRPVTDYVTGKCMADCGRAFGLLGEFRSCSWCRTPLIVYPAFQNHDDIVEVAEGCSVRKMH